MSEKVFGHRAKRRVYALLGALALAGGTVGVAACGDDDDDDSGDGGAAAHRRRDHDGADVAA